MLCPKILKIMPVDAYNGSIILKINAYSHQSYYAQGMEGQKSSNSCSNPAPIYALWQG
jgi:hypothetical protein